MDRPCALGRPEGAVEDGEMVVGEMRRALDRLLLLEVLDVAAPRALLHGFHLGRGGWYANATTLNRLLVFTGRGRGGSMKGGW